MKFSRAKMQHLKWLRRKELIRINCFIMVAILLMVLLFMGFPIVSNADEFIGLGTKYFYKDLFNSDTFTSYNGQSGYYSLDSTMLNQMKSYFLSSSDISDYYDDVDNIFKYFDLSNVNSNIIKPNNNFGIIIFVYQDNFYVGFASGRFAFNRSSKYLYNVTYVYNYNPSTHVITQVNNYNCDYVLLCTNQFYPVSYDNFNLNYLLIDGNTGNDAGGNMIGLNINDIITNHKLPYDGSCVYMDFSNLNTGHINIVAKTDSVQKEQNAFIRLNCSVSCQVRQNSSSYRSNNGIDGPYQNNFTVPNEVFNLGTFSSYDIPLNKFNSSGDLSLSLEDINKGLWNNNEKTLYSFNSCFENTSQGFSQVQKSFNYALLSIVNFMYPYENIADTSFTLLSEVWNVQVVFCIGESQEIFDSFQLDMISGSVQTQDYSLPNEDDIKNVLDVDVVPNNYNPQPFYPYYPQAVNITVPNSNSDVNNDINNNSQDNDNITVSGGENSVNVVTNINQGNKYPEKGVMQSFVRIINNDKNNTVNDLTTLTGANNYIALMNNALSVIPNEVWQIWITALKAILGIVVSAFFLKILINWAT